jgi:hypothetical protein
MLYFLSVHEKVLTIIIFSVNIPDSAIAEDFGFSSEDDDDELIPERIGRHNEMGVPSGTAYEEAAEEVGVQPKVTDIKVGTVATGTDGLSIDVAAASNADGQVDSTNIEMLADIDSMSSTVKQVGVY